MIGILYSPELVIMRQFSFNIQLFLFISNVKSIKQVVILKVIEKNWFNIPENEYPHKALSIHSPVVS